MSSLLTFGLVLAYFETRFFVAERLFTGSVLILLLLSLPGFLLHWAFLRRLRASHNATWQSLGRPTVIYYGSYVTGTRVMSFIRDRTYATLDDPYLTNVCRWYRFCILAYTAAFVGMVSGTTMLFLASR